MQLNEVDRAYLAGLTDGEGCIGIEYAARSATDPRKRARLYVNINNTHEGLIQNLKRMAGGLGSIQERDPPADKNWKKIWIWVIKGGSARWFLEQIKDYLIVKKDQATLALDGPDTEEKWLAMKALNQRGRLN